VASKGSFSLRDKPVYSTKTTPHETEDDREAEKPLSTGPIKMRLETKGRGGKTVTVLFNLPLTGAEAALLTKDLQGAFGVGGTFKDGTIELRGDLRAKVEAYALKKNLKVVRAGG
jgi:translation initiation factor 1